MNRETTYEVVTKLLGKIESVGESHIDTKRYENLENTISLVNSLLYDIFLASRSKNNQQASMVMSGKRAYEFLKELSETDYE